ncbi:MAG TPA: hypothetical protein VMM18_06135 [Gemmatimonadaceae bacterium]|nr:hypothetical protein [Gemmatimonadaceae bacterium]
MEQSHPVNNNARGWGVAALIVLLAAAFAASAWWIHVSTYCDPRDPMCRAAEAQAPGH